MNDQENTLIMRTSMMANESLPSLLRRLAELNCYDPYGLFTQLIKERSCNRDKIEFPRQVATYRDIAELTHIPISEIHTSSAHYFAEVFTPPDTSTWTRKSFGGTIGPEEARRIEECEAQNRQY